VVELCWLSKTGCFLLCQTWTTKVESDQVNSRDCSGYKQNTQRRERERHKTILFWFLSQTKKSIVSLHFERSSTIITHITNASAHKQETSQIAQLHNKKLLNVQAHRQKTYNAQAHMQDTSNAQVQWQETSHN
jgi:hypothetical protein